MCLLLRSPSNTRVRGPVLPQGPPAPPVLRFRTEGRRLCCRRSGSQWISLAPSPRNGPAKWPLSLQRPLCAFESGGEQAPLQGCRHREVGRAHGRMLCSAGQWHAKDCVVLEEDRNRAAMPLTRPRAAAVPRFSLEPSPLPSGAFPKPTPLSGAHAAPHRCGQSCPPAPEEPPLDLRRHPAGTFMAKFKGLMGGLSGIYLKPQLHLK